MLFFMVPIEKWAKGFPGFPLIVGSSNYPEGMQWSDGGLFAFMHLIFITCIFYHLVLAEVELPS